MGNQELLKPELRDTRRAIMTSKDQAKEAVLRFQGDEDPTQDGVIRQHGRLRIEYDPKRLTGGRLYDHGAEIWNIRGFIHCHPGGEVISGELLEPVRSSANDSPVISHVPVPFELTVPGNALHIEVWFHSFALGHGGRTGEAWDSRFGQNYWFEVAGYD